MPAELMTQHLNHVQPCTHRCASTSGKRHRTMKPGRLIAKNQRTAACGRPRSAEAVSRRPKMGKSWTKKLTRRCIIRCIGLDSAYMWPDHRTLESRLQINGCYPILKRDRIDPSVLYSFCFLGWFKTVRAIFYFVQKQHGIAIAHWRSQGGYGLKPQSHNLKNFWVIFTTVGSPI